MSKLIVILGVTGNQGGSVAERFLKDSRYRIRGITRNSSSPAAKAMADKGVEIVTADLNDTNSLVSAFKGANLIFSVTNYWEPFFRPDCVEAAKKQGTTRMKYSYDVEYQQGKNIADAAAATVDSLDDNGFIASTLSAARRRSGGRFTEAYHFDSKSDVFPDYVEEKYPALAAKMSCVQTGVFFTSFRLAMHAYFIKQPNGTYETHFPMSPTKPLPHLDVNADTGVFVHAVSQMPPGKSYMAAGTTCTWPEYAATWSKITGVPCTYRQVTLEEMVDNFPDKDAGKEIGEMFAYSDEPGYDGGQGDDVLIGAEGLRKCGIECPMTGLEDFMRTVDWREVLDA